MKMVFSDMGYKVGRYRAVSLDKNDTILALPKGWIFVANYLGTRLGVITCHLSKGEKIKYIDFKGLDKAVERLGGFIPPSQQVLLANNPDLRYT